MNTDQFRRYGAAFFAVLVAFLLRVALTPFVGGERFPFAAFLIAIVFCALYCGVGPSIVAVFLSLLAVWYVFLPPHFSLQLGDPRSQLQTVVAFLVLSASFIAVGESNRRTRANLAARVNERTRELHQANEAMRELSARLLQIQDEERRRVALELHDGIGQSLAAIGINVALVVHESENLSARGRECAQETLTLIQETIAELRTMSHLLHPPLLDEIGLKVALQGYVDGFVERSKIPVKLELPEKLGRLPLEDELSLFRVAQECLNNIHRHANSATAAVRIECAAGQIALEVSDNGRGISRELREKLLSGQGPGVGLRGMRERVRQLGGTLQIESNGHGTIVRVTLPLQNATDPPSGNCAHPAVRATT